MNDINLGEALEITLSSMLIVFSVLLILMALITLFQFLPNIEIRSNRKKEEDMPVQSFEDMDEEMKVAALVASIEYKKESNKEVKLKSVRRI